MAPVGRSAQPFSRLDELIVGDAPAGSNGQIHSETSPIVAKGSIQSAPRYGFFSPF
jgi:hypothetical protein